MQRRAITATVLGVAAFAATAHAAASVERRSGAPEVGAAISLSRPANVVTRVPVRYREKAFGVAVTHNMVYRRAPNHSGMDESLLLDIYEPANDREDRRAAILWLHSGGFTTGDKSEQRAYADEFARRGYVSIAIDYRLRPNMQWFDMAQRPYAARDAYDDATAALAWIRAHTAKYRIDTRHLFAAGYSAGAISAQELASPPDGTRPTVAGVMSISGYGISAARPVQAPRLVFHGTRDFLVPYAFDERSCAQARDAGDRCDLVTFIGGEHGIGFSEYPAIVKRTAKFFAAIIDGTS
jgi:acetyl esterase/lipase